MSKQSSFEISKVVIELLVSLVGESNFTFKSALEKTLEAVQKSSSDTTALFGYNSCSAKSGNFQIVLDTLGNQGQVTVALIACYFEAEKVDYGFLFSTYNDSNIKLFTSAEFLILNEEVYEEIRDDIAKKLQMKLSLIKPL